MHIRAATPEERSAALELALDHLGVDIRPARVLNALALVAAGEIDPNGVFVAIGSAGVCGVVVAVPLAGASGLFWLPKTTPTDETLEIQLVQAALGWLRQRGVKVAQAIVSPLDNARIGTLRRSGFRAVTRLNYLEHSLQSVARPLASRLNLITYNRCSCDLFHATLLRTYEGSFDCPELNGVRAIEEIIDGHKAQGVYNPERWWLAMTGNRPVGVALATSVPDLEAWDLSYLGVVPEERRRGLGRELTLQVLQKARAEGAPKLLLAVDSRNKPGLQLYRKLGFLTIDYREIYLYFWDRPIAGGQPG